MNYTHLELGIEYLPYWDDAETTESETTTDTTDTTEDTNNIELPF